jgi:holo-[acyl-carrier protein] synthase
MTHGVDLVEIAELRRWLNEPRSQVDIRFTDREMADAEGTGAVPHLAGCFATKEATLKALGVGWSNGIAWTDIELVRTESGVPELVLHASVAKRAADLGLPHWRVSLSHTTTTAVAVVLGWSAD